MSVAASIWTLFRRDGIWWHLQKLPLNGNLMEPSKLSTTILPLPSCCRPPLKLCLWRDRPRCPSSVFHSAHESQEPTITTWDFAYLMIWAVSFFSEDLHRSTPFLGCARTPQAARIGPQEHRSCISKLPRITLPGDRSVTTRRRFRTTTKGWWRRVRMLIRLHLSLLLACFPSRSMVATNRRPSCFMLDLQWRFAGSSNQIQLSGWFAAPRRRLGPVDYQLNNRPIETSVFAFQRQVFSSTEMCILRNDRNWYEKFK